MRAMSLVLDSSAGTALPDPTLSNLAPCHGRRFLPYVGMVTIVMNDYPMLKYVLIGVLGLLVITSKE